MIMLTYISNSDHYNKVLSCVMNRKLVTLIRK